MTKKLKKTKKTKAVPFYKRHWGSNEARYRTRMWHHAQKVVRFERPRLWWKERRWWQKIIIVLCSLAVLWVGTMYGIAQWYIASQSGKPVVLGTTFIPRYAEYLGLNPQEVFQALTEEMGMNQFRLVSYWDDIEKTPGQYDFSELDWQFKMAEDNGAAVSLAIGLRQPRWPECHMPQWAKDQPMEVWAPQLKTFMGEVINRYKDSPALQSYQLENEFFLTAFGECPDFSRDRLIDEFNFVKQQDPNHPIIINRSNNALGIPIGQPQPDEFGVSVYKRVWDKTITKRYFEYPFPAWYYAYLAGLQKIVLGKNMIIHELQAEPWMPEGYSLNTSSLEEQNKSINAERLQDRINYGKATGMKSIDLWGAEWWYWRKVKRNDPSLWNTVKANIDDVQNTELYKTYYPED